MMKESQLLKVITPAEHRGGGLVHLRRDSANVRLQALPGPEFVSLTKKVNRNQCQDRGEEQSRGKKQHERARECEFINSIDQG